MAADREAYLVDHVNGGGISFVGSGHLLFAVSLSSVSDDGVVRFKIANVSAIDVSEVRGSIEYSLETDIQKPLVKKSVGFVVDRRMQTGKWVDVSVALEGKEKDLSGFLKIKNLQVKNYWFSNQSGN